MEQLETGNIGIGNISTLATLNSDRFIIVDQKEIFWTGASLKDAGRLTFAAKYKLHLPSEQELIAELRRERTAIEDAQLVTKLNAGRIRRIKKSASATAKSV